MWQNRTTTKWAALNTSMSTNDQQQLSSKSSPFSLLMTRPDIATMSCLAFHCDAASHDTARQQKILICYRESTEGNCILVATDSSKCCTSTFETTTHLMPKQFLNLQPQGARTGAVSSRPGVKSRSLMLSAFGGPASGTFAIPGLFSDPGSSSFTICSFSESGCSSNPTFSFSSGTLGSVFSITPSTFGSFFSVSSVSSSYRKSHGLYLSAIWPCWYTWHS